MRGETNILIDITRKASKLVQRDYFELEQLQSSQRNVLTFCQQSCVTATKRIHEYLSKYFKYIAFNESDLNNFPAGELIALVEVLDGFTNFSKALPFFGMMITVVKKEEGNIIAEKSVINFPAIGKIYYCNKGKGSWVEKHSSNLAGTSRTRVSAAKHLKDVVVATDLPSIEYVKKDFSNIRMFNSYTYSLAMFLSGKIDLLAIEINDYAKYGAELFIKEAAGVCKSEQGIFIASNIDIMQKI